VKYIRPGGIIVDMTTSEPALAKAIAEAALARNICVLDAPVSGGDIGARNATLSIMAGGNAEAFNTVLPYFNIMGKNIRRMGESGCGQHTKMVKSNILSFSINMYLRFYFLVLGKPNIDINNHDRNGRRIAICT
jgi:3-hydroxyisobutyrate dehydrogenase